MAAVTTPEAEIDLDLPPILRPEGGCNARRKELMMEIPDSEEASEFSSPVKIAMEEKRDEASERQDGLQGDQQASDRDLEQGDTPKAQENMVVLEIPDSEVASEVSSPVKIDTGTETSNEEPLVAAAELKPIGESLEDDTEDVDTTMLDVPAPVRGDGVVEGESSRATKAAEAEEAGSSVKAMVMDDRKGAEHTLEHSGGLVSSGDKDGELAQGIAAPKAQEVSTRDASPSFDDSKSMEQEASPTGADFGVTDILVTPIKAAAGATESPATSSGLVSVSSPALDRQEIAIAAQKLLADEISPTVSDVSGLTENPAASMTVTAIPESHKYEDEELPEAPGIQQHDFRESASKVSSAKNISLPSATIPASMEGTSEGLAQASSALGVGIVKQGHKKGVKTSAASLGDRNPEKDSSTSPSSSPVKALIAPPTKKNAGPNHSPAKSQSPQSTKSQAAAEPKSSPPKAPAANKPPKKSLEQPTAAMSEASSQGTDIPSSPLDPIKGTSFKAKRKESPNASFTAPKASPTKDVVMAELKAMKIASIQNRISSLETEISNKRAKLEEVTKDLKQPASETVKRHIKLLHDYNDIRDVGQGLVGMIADNRGVRIGELYDEFGVGLKD